MELVTETLSRVPECRTIRLDLYTPLAGDSKYATTIRIITNIADKILTQQYTKITDRFVGLSTYCQ